MKNLVLVELNELNISIIERYIESGAALPNFKKLIENGVVHSSSEAQYELLEPWIQWVSAHTGLEYSEHNIFRLGDMANSQIPQIFDVLEEDGISVGAISAMNSRNDLKSPDFFIPDPWTYTTTDGSWPSSYLDQALKQAVGDNAQGRVTKATYLRLSFALFKLLKLKQIFQLMKKFKNIKGKSYRKAIFLDCILADVFANKIKTKNTKFSTLFLNAGAHIQHHYFHNSAHVHVRGCDNPSWYIEKEADPLIEVLQSYDEILGELLANEDFSLLVATGLTQDPTKSLKFYYRLRDHAHFLNKLNIKFSGIKPRMTRDFLIEFDDHEDLKDAKDILESCYIDGGRAFEEIEVRDDSLFVTLTYGKEITEDSQFIHDGLAFSLFEHVVFVALKNGEHNANGFILSNNSSLLNEFQPNGHIKNLFHVIKNYFENPPKYRV